MDNQALRDDGLGEAERLAILYAPQALRGAYRAALLLDARLGRIALTAREPGFAQLKLAWWRDACGDLAKARNAPVLLDLERDWTGDHAALLGLIDGWEAMVAGEGAFAGNADHLAEARAVVCAAAAGVPPGAACRTAAQRWTLVALATAAPDQDQRGVMRERAKMLRDAPLPRSLRPLAMLDGLAKRALRLGSDTLLGDRLSPLAALRLGIFGR